jgi:hypothetical protein
MATSHGAPAIRGWLDPTEWKRDSRGRHWEFVVPTEEIVRAIGAVQEERKEHFELLTCFRQQHGSTWLSLYEAQRVEQLSLDGPWQYFIRSSALTPALPDPEPTAGVGWPGALATNGLVLLHHPDPARGGESSRSSIGIVNRVRSETTGEVREHRDYDAVFVALKRKLKTS